MSGIRAVDQPNAGIVEENTSSRPSNSDQDILSHCHLKEQDVVENHKARRTLIIASILCLSFMVAEVIGGYIAGSLAIITDAAHLLTDFASFLISLFSLFMATRPATRRMSFGWHRAEVLGAFISVLFIWIITGVLVYVAIERIVNKSYEIRAGPMLITAAVGVFVNVVMGILLHQGGHHHGHSHSSGVEKSRASSNRTPRKEMRKNLPASSTTKNYQEFNEDSSSLDSLIDDTVSLENGLLVAHSHSSSNNLYVNNNDDEIITIRDGGVIKKHRQQNINVRAAFIHVLGDFFQSVGVLIAAYIIYYHPELQVVDPVCTFIFSFLVLLTTIAIMRDALNVLMEGSPRSIDFLEVADTLSAIKGVVRVHNLRIWSLTLDKIALSVHLAISDNYDSQDVLKSAMNILRTQFKVYECTVQIEHYSNDMDECVKCEHPRG
uniref:Zinc transporter 2 n=1 Tax=Romanomermis culicivorax TaxID=13658 RepID=A0A915I8Q9_ROMCU